MPRVSHFPYLHAVVLAALCVAGEARIQATRHATACFRARDFALAPAGTPEWQERELQACA